jgi:carotenoid cleavage dioxygenase
VFTELPCEGALPTGLDGLYARTGPNPSSLDSPRWEMADGMVHGVRMEGGRALWYRNRWITTPEVARRLGRDAPRQPPAMVAEGTGNHALVAHAGQLLACSDMALPYRLSTTLETLGITDFGGPLPAGSISHPKLDPATGSLHTLAYHFDAPYLRHHVIDARGQLLSSRELPVDRPIHVHDFALTRRWLLIFDMPRLFSEDALLEGRPQPYVWQPDAGARVGLIPREGHDAVLWFDAPSQHIEHVAAVNGDGAGRLIVDLILGEAHAAAPTAGTSDATCLARWTLDPARGAMLTEILDGTPQGMPTGDPRTLIDGRRWLWTLALDEEAAPGSLGPRAGGLLRHDLRSGARERVRLGADLRVGEMILVPAHPRAAEDEGWLLGFCWEGEPSRAGLLVLDARAPDRGPVARLRIPGAVPPGAHGCWMALERGR